MARRSKPAPTAPVDWGAEVEAAQSDIKAAQHAKREAREWFEAQKLEARDRMKSAVQGFDRARARLERAQRMLKASNPRDEADRERAADRAAAKALVGELKQRLKQARADAGRVLQSYNYAKSQGDVSYVEDLEPQVEEDANHIREIEAQLKRAETKLSGYER